jgi:dTDP-4-amino-4,6-dideoxygalactose transaminase
VKLNYLDEWNKRRRENAANYTELLSSLNIITPYIADYADHIFHQYTIQLKDNRDGLHQFLNENKIPNAIYYPIPLHLQDAYVKTSGYKKGDFPVSEKMAERVLSLPMHPDLTREEQAFIADKIKAFMNSQ